MKSLAVMAFAGKALKIETTGKKKHTSLCTQGISNIREGLNIDIPI
jgi:hypothetical protein